MIASVQVLILGADGVLAIPEEMREALGLRAGDPVSLSLVDGEVRLKPARSVAERTFGALHVDGPAIDFRELRRIFEEGTAEEVEAERARETLAPR